MNAGGVFVKKRKWRRILAATLAAVVLAQLPEKK